MTRHPSKDDYDLSDTVNVHSSSVAETWS